MERVEGVLVGMEPGVAAQAGTGPGAASEAEARHFRVEVMAV